MIENETDSRSIMKGMAQSLDNMAEALTMIAREKGLRGVVVNFRPREIGGFDIHLTATNDLDERAIARHILDGLKDAFTTILQELNAKLEAVSERSINSVTPGTSSRDDA